MTSDSVTRSVSARRDWDVRDRRGPDTTQELSDLDLRNPERVLRDPDRDLRDPERDLRVSDWNLTYRPAPQRSRPRHAAEPDDDELFVDHFFDADERLAMGDDEAYEYRKARVSWLSVTGLILGVIGMSSALTSDLAPIGLAAGFVGLMLAVGGLVASTRPYVASQPLALLALA
ncbi:MAG: hypothetical protein ACRDUA_15250, partial [Micromonosporaceae bacterium]